MFPGAENEPEHLSGVVAQRSMGESHHAVPVRSGKVVSLPIALEVLPLGVIGPTVRLEYQVPCPDHRVDSMGEDGPPGQPSLPFDRRYARVVDRSKEHPFQFTRRRYIAVCQVVEHCSEGLGSPQACTMHAVEHGSEIAKVDGTANEAVVQGTLQPERIDRAR